MATSSLYQINELIQIADYIDNKTEGTYDFVLKFKLNSPINPETNKIYRFFMIAIRSDGSQDADYLQYFIPARAREQNEPQTRWQDDNSKIKKLYDPLSAAAMDAEAYYNEPTYEYSHGFGKIKWKNLKYNIKYKFNAGFTDLQGNYTTGFCDKPLNVCRVNKSLNENFNYREAPVLESVLAAFLETASVVQIPFSTSEKTSANYVECKIQSAYNGKSILKKEVNYKVFPISKTKDFFSIESNQLIGESWEAGMYKIQIRLKYSDTQKSSWSNYAIIKVLGIQPTGSISNNFTGLASITAQEMTLNPVFTGTYKGESSEILHQYRFILKENNIKIDDSGWLTHFPEKDIVEDSINTSVNTYCFNRILDPLNTYEVIYQGITINNYQFENTYKFTVYQPNIVQFNALSATADSEEGSLLIKLNLDQIKNGELEEGQYRLIREEKKSSSEGKKNAQILFYCNKTDLLNSEKIVLQNDDETTTTILIFYKDYTIEDGYNYVYKLQYLNILNEIEYEYVDQVNNYYSTNFDYNYLVGEGLQLKIKYDNQMNSFKYNILQTKQDTLGSRYPVILRNGEAYYAEFPISGLITLNMDENHNFLKKKREGYYFKNEMIIPNSYYLHLLKENIPDRYDFEKNEMLYKEVTNEYETFNSNLIPDNIYIERKFREKVEEFLNNGKPKLFKSSTEGNKLVALTNVTFTPKTELGRAIYSFQATAYEIGECIYDNFLQYNIIDINKHDDISYYFKNKTKFIHKNLKENEIYNLSSLQDDLNMNESIYSLTEYRLNNISFIRVENFDKNQSALLLLNDQKINIPPARSFYIPINECQNFSSFQVASDGGSIDLIVEYNIFKRKNLKNKLYLGLLGNIILSTNQPIVLGNVNNSQNIKSENNLLNLFHDQILKINNNTILDWQLNDENNGYKSQIDEYRLDGIETLQIFNIKASSEPIAKVYINQQDINEDTPYTLLTNQLFFSVPANDLITSIFIIPCTQENIDLNITAIGRVEYSVMEGVIPDEIVQ